MVIITNLEGQGIEIDPADVLRITGALPIDAPPRTYVYGATPAPLFTSEAPDALMKRLGIVAAFAELTRPDGSPVWVRAAKATAWPPDPDGPPNGHATVKIDARIFVRETPDEARALIGKR